MTSAPVRRRDRGSRAADPARWALALALTAGALGTALPKRCAAAGPEPQGAHAKHEGAKAAAEKKDGGTTTATTAEATAKPAEPSPEELRAREAEQKRLDALQREYERIAGENAIEDKPAATKPGEPSNEPSIFGAFVKMVFVLGGVCVLAYLLLGKLLPRLMKIEAPVARNHIMTVIDRLPLDQRRAIMVLRIGDGFYLVGASDNGISLLSKLDADEVEAALARQASAKAEPGRIASVFGKKV